MTSFPAFSWLLAQTVSKTDVCTYIIKENCTVALGHEFYFLVLKTIKKKTVIDCVCKGHRDKIKEPDPVVKDLISEKNGRQT